MKRNGSRLVSAVVVCLAMFALVLGTAVAAPKGGKGKHHHHNGHQTLGSKLKTNGTHQLDKKGNHTVTADVKDGKIAGVHVKHATKGDVAVKKYKTNKKMASADSVPPEAVAADEYAGTVWIGYAYINDDGDEEIYWFPYDVIIDGDTGAVEYIPA